MAMIYDLLNSAISNGILDEITLQQAIDMATKKKYLEMHKYRVYQGSDGRWYTYVQEEGKERRKIKRNTRADLEDAIIIFYKEIEENPTIRQVFDDWQDRRLEIGKIKPATYTRNEQIFERHFEEFGERRIKNITPDELCDFMEEQITKYDLTSRAFSNLKSIVRGFLKRAKRKNYISFSVDTVLSEIDVSDRDFKPRVVDDSKEIFYDDEYDAILSYCYLYRKELKTLGVALMLVSGIRVGELVALKQNDISNMIVSVHRTETRYKKDGHYHWEISEYPKTPAGIRQVIIADSFDWIINGLVEVGGNGFIFIGKGGNRLHTQAIYKQIKRICEKLGMPKRSPHKARKTYGSILLDNHIDSKVIEKQMGHTDILTTKIHYHRDRKRTEKKRQIINAIPEFQGYLSTGTSKVLK